MAAASFQQTADTYLTTAAVLFTFSRVVIAALALD